MKRTDTLNNGDRVTVGRRAGEVLKVERGQDGIGRVFVLFDEPDAEGVDGKWVAPGQVRRGAAPEPRVRVMADGQRFPQSMIDEYNRKGLAGRLAYSPASWTVPTSYNPAEAGIQAARADARQIERTQREVADLYSTCPGCSADLTGAAHEPGSDVLKRCPGCGGLVGGPVTAADLERFVRSEWDKNPSMDDARYYDVAVWDGLGWDRFHGWFSTLTKKILQTG